VITLKKIEADLEKYGPAALEAIGVALKIMGVGGDAPVVLAGVETALKSFANGAAAGADPAAILAELAKLAPDIAADDAAADAAVKAKFPGSTP
jgi:hypothetical protein